MGAYNVANRARLASGQPEDVSDVLANLDLIASILNGGIDNSNVNAAAAIVLSKLAGYPTDGTKFASGDGTWKVPPYPASLLKKNSAKQVVNSIAATDLLNGEITIAANALAAAGLLRFTAWGSYIQNTGAPQASLRFQLVLGGTTILDTNVLAGTSASNGQILPWRASVIIVPQGVTNVQFAQLDVDYLAVAAAGSASLYTTGSGIHRQEAATGGYAFVHGQGYNTAAIDMTIARLLELRVINPVANVNMGTTLSGALVEIM